MMAPDFRLYGGPADGGAVKAPSRAVIRVGLKVVKSDGPDSPGCWRPECPPRPEHIRVALYQDDGSGRKRYRFQGYEARGSGEAVLV